MAQWQDTAGKSSLKLGINGLGRIGKLTLWHHVGRKYFSELVVNIGREAGYRPLP
jgi:glyceraldehyde 3-phosphate dehydrogenase